MSAPAHIAELIARYGHNSNSFVTLYEGYRYFELPDTVGVLPYLETPHAWIGAGEPVAPPQSWAALLRAFRVTAAACGKAALLIPAGENGRNIAIAEGYGALKIGAEPVLELATYEPAIDTVTTARRLYDRGARVTEFYPNLLPSDLRRELDAMVAEWLASRKMDPLGFLNRVEPWTLSLQKKYFRTVSGGRTLAFVAAVPIPVRGGWYLIDIIRRESSPPGSTELLILEATRLLKAQGAQWVTLGMAPLADLDGIADGPHRRLTRLLGWIYRYGGLTYNFRPLHQFKLKFRPSASEPCYLLFSTARLGLAHVRGILEATVGSPGKALRSVVRKRLQRLDWLGAIETRLARDFVLRPTPRSPRDILKRMPFTLSLFVVLSALYALASEEHARRFAFSWQAMESVDLGALAGSHLLHGGLGHLAANLLLLVMGAGTLEYFRGTSFTVVIYGLCALLANPLTAAACLPARWLAPDLWNALLQETDVGASLGIFGCVGSLVTILKQQNWVLPVLGIFYFGFAVLSHNPLALSHVTALLLGAAIETVL